MNLIQSWENTNIVQNELVFLPSQASGVGRTTLAVAMSPQPATYSSFTSVTQAGRHLPRYPTIASASTKVTFKKNIFDISRYFVLGM